jgi:cyclic beta-1,2-glucan synthetase
MKMGNKTRRSSFRHRKDRFLDKRLIRKTSGEEVPLRSELLSSDQMKQHGKRLAASHIISPERIPDQHLKRLAENERVLIETYSLLLTAIKRNPRIAPAEEWFLDNFYLIEEQIRTAKRYLPKKYSRELPCLLSGPSAGLPRVYDIALEVILHGDGRVDMENLVSFVTSYQTLVDLNLGELWAIPIMLRLTLIENLRRIAARISARRINLDLANYWADRMMEIAEKDPKNLILVIADMARSNPPMEGSFVAELTHRLQGQSPALALPLSWVEQRLTESGLTIELLVRSENQQQAADQVSLSNSIGSLRFLGAMDWREFVETASIVDRVLREDPSGVYGKMDFSTRDHYRHVVEKIAKSSHCSESEVARKAIQLARKGTSGKDKDDRTAHVGYYLIDKGLTQLERIMGVHLSLPLVFGRIIRRFSLFFYLGTIILMTGIFTWSLLNITPANMLTGWLLSLVGVLSLLGTSQLGVVLTNWLVSLLVKPDSLPRMDFSKGIPPESCTLVVIPSMLASTRHIEDLIEALEVRYLANLDQNLHFCLLTDFLDAKEETMPDDKVLLQVARLGIETLIEKYRDTKGGQFFLLHRPRQWNPNEKVWMGYERKRGKLIELNSFLRGGAKDRFSLIIGNAEILQKIKYVITLDTDTQHILGQCFC